MARSTRTRRKAKRRGRYHHGNLRAALIEAGLALVARGGPEALTLREAARRAGVTEAAPYRHFADKHALLAAVAEEGFRAMAEDMRKAAAGHETDPLGRLHAFGMAYIDFARAHPAHFRVMFGAELADRSAHPRLQVAATEAFDLLRATVAECQRAGLMVGSDAVAMAVRLWSATHGLAFLLLYRQLEGRGGEDPEALANGLTATFFLGAAPREAMPRSQTCADRPVSGDHDNGV